MVAKKIDNQFDKNKLDPVNLEMVDIGSMPYLEWVEGTKVPKGQFGWCAPHGDAFKVRGQAYMKDKKKYPAGENTMKLLSMDWFVSEERAVRVAERKSSVCSELLKRPDVAFVFVVAIQFPSKKHYTMVKYFGTPTAPEEESLLGRFMYGDDKFRNERIKLIPRVLEGAWVVQRAVGAVPVLLGKAVKLDYHQGPGYLEMDVNIGSSSAAHTALKCVFGYARNLVIDMAWVIEGRSEEELPEGVIGSMRMSYLEPDLAVELPPLEE